MPKRYSPVTSNTPARAEKTPAKLLMLNSVRWFSLPIRPLGWNPFWLVGQPDHVLPATFLEDGGDIEDDHEQGHFMLIVGDVEASSGAPKQR